MELPLLLALASALTWGAGDFFGGLATREAKAVGTTLVSQFVGLVGLVVVSLLGAGGSLVGKDLAWGTAAGLCAVAGLGMFYEAMGRGAFGPVASVTSVVSGGIPIVVGLVLGERPPLMVLIGVYVAVVAIWLIAGEKSKPGETQNSRSAMILALGAGVCFGGYFVLLSRAGGESGLWPLVAGRVAASLALALTILILGYGNADASWLPPVRSLRLAAIAGLLDASANALYFYASRNGLLSVVAVLASMYPASTILLARVALHEQVNRRRMAGMVAGLVAVSVIARGGAGDVSDDPSLVHASGADKPAVSGPEATQLVTALAEPPPTTNSGGSTPAQVPAAIGPEALALTPTPDEFFAQPFIDNPATPPPTADEFFAQPFIDNPATPPPTADEFFAQPFVDSTATPPPTADEFFAQPFVDNPATPPPTTDEFFAQPFVDSTATPPPTTDEFFAQPFANNTTRPPPTTDEFVPAST